MPILRENQKFIFVSALLHALVALALTFSWSQNSAPLGVHRQGTAVVEFSIPAVVQSAVAKAKAVIAPTVDKTSSTKLSNPSEESSSLVQKAASESLGFADGVKSSAALGQADGMAQSERERYLYELRVLIEQKKVYPQISKRLRETGRVVIQLQVLKDGRIEAVDIKSASSHARLNEAALGLVRSIEKFRPFPQTVANDQLSLEIPIEYVLN